MKTIPTKWYKDKHQVADFAIAFINVIYVVVALCGICPAYTQNPIAKITHELLQGWALVDVVERDAKSHNNESEVSV